MIDALPRPLGFVPTMGALHAGHEQLLHQERERSGSSMVSIFVNPLQFGPSENFAKYPRDLETDRSTLEQAGVDALFAPGVAEMYPDEFTTSIDVGPVAETFEGVVRPHHFRGVATVVAKLLHIVRPDVLYLGQKDAQQTSVLRKMIDNLEFRVAVTIVPTIRESDGLAMSSRNAYLNASERAEAPSLYAALTALREALERGRSKQDAIAAARAVLSPLATPEYFDVVDTETFEPIGHWRSPAYVIGAARFGTTRLIDNLHADAPVRTA